MASASDPVAVKLLDLMNEKLQAADWSDAQEPVSYHVGPIPPETLYPTLGVMTQNAPLERSTTTRLWFKEEFLWTAVVEIDLGESSNPQRQLLQMRQVMLTTLNSYPSWVDDLFGQLAVDSYPTYWRSTVLPMEEDQSDLLVGTLIFTAEYEEALLVQP